MRIWLLTSEIPQEISAGIARYVDTWARVLGAAGHGFHNAVVAARNHAESAFSERSPELPRGHVLLRIRLHRGRSEAGKQERAPAAIRGLT